jgi:phenylacetic acid degradation operon negative regulatory protein
MLRSGARRIYAFGDPWEWDGQWLLIVLRVAEERREVRHQIRTTLAWEGFGSLGGGLWVTPHVEREASIRALATEHAEMAEVISFRAGLGTIGDPRRLVAQAWDLESVARTYEEFLAAFGRMRADTPERAFRAQTLLVHAWRRFPFLDPEIPKALLPDRWPRDRAHALFSELHGRWADPAEAFFAALDGAGDRTARGSAAA